MGEAKIYDLLCSIPCEENTFAVHSVNLPEHEYKRWGEIDYVVISRAGITLLEVKGGIVTLAGRVWRYENARGKAIESSEGPAKQAISSAVALEKLLTKKLGKKLRCRWGVAFPLSSFKRDLDELPPERLADVEICSNPASFNAWLDGIPFDQHSASDFALDETDIEKIREILLPEFSVSPSLGLTAGGIQENVFRLTDQQYAILDSLQRNDRLTIIGGAGTGKTELAVMCARSELASGRKPVIVTRGMALVTALKERLSGSGIVVTEGSVPDGCDVLIVDEGQDFTRSASMVKLFSRIPGGLAGGRWRWFMDPNLQFMDAPPEKECLAELERHSTAVTLLRNVRSTREIVGCIRTFLASDVGLTGIDGFGVRVQFHDVTDAMDEAMVACRVVENAIEEGVSAAEIAVLSAHSHDGPAASIVRSRIGDLLKPMNANGNFQSRTCGVISSIREFRGMESRIVVLVDLESESSELHFRRDLYLGMSRASASLHVLISRTTKARLLALLNMNT